MPSSAFILSIIKHGDDSDDVALAYSFFDERLDLGAGDALEARDERYAH